MWTVELEFINFQVPSEDGYQNPGGQRNLHAFLDRNAPSALRPLTGGMFGYSLTIPVANKEYFYDIFSTSEVFGCNVESWHTESGPGVFEAALKVNAVDEMADRVSLFKSVPETNTNER